MLAKITHPSQLAALIDHTLLKIDATADQIRTLCAEARQFGFASVCVYPKYIKLAKSELLGTNVRPIAVVGFPTGLDSSNTKKAQAEAAIADGALEIDMVLNLAALKEKKYKLVSDDIAEVHRICSPLTLKVILEMSELTQQEKIIACALSVSSGANFVKTSTGFLGGATVEDVQLMRDSVGPSIGVKASGGIRDFETAKRMIDAGANRLGTSNSVHIVKGVPANTIGNY